MKKLSGSKLPVEVKGHMSPEGADRVGLLMAIAMVIERLLRKIVVSIILVGLIFQAYKLALPVADADEQPRDDVPYAYLPTQLFEFECSRVQRQ